MEGSRMDLRFTFALLLALAMLALFVKPGHARNEYLQYDSHCDGPTLEPYVEYSQTENMGTGSSSSGYNDDRATAGVRLRIPLGSTCSKQYRKTFNENALLRQQLELLKMCGRYKNLELGEEFSEIKRKCSQVWRKEGTAEPEKEVPETLLAPLVKDKD
jgi:hypothetical protein